jgi:hypothetical protein
MTFIYPRLQFIDPETVFLPGVVFFSGKTTGEGYQHSSDLGQDHIYNRRDLIATEYLRKPTSDGKGSERQSMASCG